MLKRLLECEYLSSLDCSILFFFISCTLTDNIALKFLFFRYRRSLRLLDSWAISRDIFNTEGEEIRRQFDSNKHLDPNSAECDRVMKEAYQKLADYYHPDQYTVPYMPGSSKFMRNAPPALKAVFPDGIPPEYNFVSQTVEATQIDGKYTTPYDTVLIDFSKKTAE
jgi:NADH dehydrogenase (ubiquinone) 1 beta subcomplex subunit 9